MSNKESQEKLINITPDSSNQIKNKTKISFFRLQYYIKSSFKYLILIASLASFLNGFTFPIFNFLFGQTMNKLLNTISTKSDMMTIIKTMSFRYMILALVTLINNMIITSLWTIIGKKIVIEIKKDYFKLVLQQEQTYFDSQNTFQFSTKIQSQMKTVETGLGMKVGMTISIITTSFVSYLFAFLTSWKLTLIMLSIFPFLFICGTLLGRLTTQIEMNKRKSYEKAGGLAEEVLYNIKTVSSLGNYLYEKMRFNKEIGISEKNQVKDGLFTSIIFFFLFFLVYGSYSLAIWYGAVLIINNEKNIITGESIQSGDIISVILSVVFSSIGLGASGPNIKAISEACEASYDYFQLNDKEKLKNEQRKKEKNLIFEKKHLKGGIKFENVCFKYKTKELDDDNLKIESIGSDLDLDLDLFNRLSFEIKPGKKIAIVGESGNGKSTIVNLIERLYRVNSGSILFDNVSIYDYDIKFYRSLFGYVGQEPVLFNTSIKDNIIFGRDDENYSKEDIDKALKDAYAYDFIYKMKENINYKPGVKGSRLSGGQKQRIAIARAILGNPKVLIFDEATSALDNQSQRKIQMALDRISKNRELTTIIIAHRLSTIVNADEILVLKNGKIEEVGSHDELIRSKGYYYDLFNSQSQQENIKRNDEEDEENHEKINENHEEKEEIQLKNNENEEENENKLNKEKENIIYNQSRKKFLSLLKNIKFSVFVAFLSALVAGLGNPLYGYLISHTLIDFSLPNKDEVWKKSIENCITFIIFAFVFAFSMFLLFFSFSIIGSKLVSSLRKNLFSHYLSLHMGFFDLPENSPGSLLTKLSNDTTNLNSIAFQMIGTIIQSISSITFGLGLGFYYEWRLTLILLGFIPLIVIGGRMQSKRMQGHIKDDEKIEYEAGSILSESVNNSKTVLSYNFQAKALDLYSSSIDIFNKGFIKNSITQGFWYGLTMSFTYIAFGVIYYVGGLLIMDNITSAENMNNAIFCVLTAAFGINNAQMYLRDIDKARESLISIYKVLNTKSEINPFEKGVGINNDFKGKIEFRNVVFKYPSRPDSIVLNNISFTLNPGQSIAFVGPSGSGKSSIIQLLLRFYDVNSGEILIDNVNIKEYSLIDIRKKFGLVLQEPVLFKTSVIENIRYGKLESSDEKCREMAKLSYIDKFFDENKNVNCINIDKSLVSGGEKQRIAIARAIINDPIILLLDEATSALDVNSEKIVQAALDEIIKSKTSITIAHRLSTIEKSDVIYVIENGEILEKGSFSELVNLKGNFHRLYRRNE